MQTQRDYTISAKGCHYDIKQHKPVQEKNENTIYFASKGEFNCYLSLKQMFKDKFKITTQPRYKKDCLDWRLDFKIEGKTILDFKTLANIARYCNDADFKICSFLLIEYKGFADANFRAKIKRLAEIDPLTYNLLIVLSRKEGLYTFYINGKKFSKPIYTIEKLKYIIDKLI